MPGRPPSSRNSASSAGAENPGEGLAAEAAGAGVDVWANADIVASSAARVGRILVMGCPWIGSERDLRGGIATVLPARGDGRHDAAQLHPGHGQRQMLGGRPGGEHVE